MLASDIFCKLRMYCYDMTMVLMIMNDSMKIKNNRDNNTTKY